MSGFLETRVENLETPAPLQPVSKLTRTKRNKNSKKQKDVSFEDSDKKNPSKKKFCQYHGNCSHSTEKCIALKKKTYTKHKVYVLIEKNLKKVLKGRKKRKQDLRT